jgi:hypothetical protein
MRDKERPQFVRTIYGGGNNESYERYLSEGMLGKLLLTGLVAGTLTMSGLIAREVYPVIKHALFGYEEKPKSLEGKTRGQ